MRSPPAEGFELRGESTPLSDLVRELWHKRRLIRLLARRDFHVRYRRPTFGLLWVVAVPVIHAAVLSAVFSIVVRVPTGGVPRPVFMLTGLLPWMYFSSTLSAAVTSITGGSGLATKVYFPRAMLPLLIVRSNLYGYGPRVVIVLASLLIFGVGIKLSILMLVPATFLMVALAAAFALVLAALHVYFRDMSFIMQVITQAWFYASGVFFPVDIVPEGILRTIVELNPATGMVYFFRASTVGSPLDLSLLWSPLIWTFALIAVAAFLYRRFDRVFVDLL